MIYNGTRKTVVNSKLWRRRRKKQWPLSRHHHGISLEGLMRTDIKSEPQNTFIGGYLNMLPSGYKTVAMPVA